MNKTQLEISRYDAEASFDNLKNNITIKQFIHSLHIARKYTDLCLNSCHSKNTQERCIQNANSESNQELLLMLKTDNYSNINTISKSNNHYIFLNSIFHALSIEKKIIDLFTTNLNNS
tara:strand:- start:404 stop:757 length:354 start_codon:yes stop_codon:yes gene_type:complete